MLAITQGKTTKKAHKRYQNISKEEKAKKWQYGGGHYKNLSEDEKQNLIEYRKRCYRMRTNFIIIIRRDSNLENLASL